MKFNTFYNLPRKNRKVKTIEVQEIKKYFNGLLSLDSISQEIKAGYCNILWDILSTTGNYNGFNYLTWINGGYAKYIQDGKPESTSPYLGKEYDRFYY